MVSTMVNSHYLVSYMVPKSVSHFQVLNLSLVCLPQRESGR